MNIGQAIVRTAMVHFLGDYLPLYIVNEYPKSGGTWVGQMLSRALDVPFPRNCMPKFETSIMHGHYIHPFGMRNVLCLWRDGRDVTVSWYYHCLFKNEHHNANLVERMRRDLRFDDYDNVYQNLPEFIEYIFTNQKHPAFSWTEFVYKWYGRNGIVYARYEDLRENTARELERIVQELSGKSIGQEKASQIVDEFSFLRLSGRKQGIEKKNSFMRKGIVGDWKDQFSQEAKEVFNKYAGEPLIKLGYESDNSWVYAIQTK